MFKPLVTVMIPTYNQSKYISMSINSVLAQTYDNIEIIVSDNSTDNLTEEIVSDKFSKVVKYIHHKESYGRVRNYHFLLHSFSKGEWVINLDGDDFFYDKNFIKRSIDEINKEGDIVLVFGKQIIYKELLDKEYRYNNKYLKEGVLVGNNLFLETIYRNIEIPHLVTLYNRKEAIKVGFYKSNIISSDRESLLKLLLNNKVVFLDMFAGVWNHHGSNISQNTSVDDFFTNLEMYDNLYAYAREHTQILKHKLWFWKVLAKYKNIYAYLVKMIETNDRKKIKTFFKKLSVNYFLFFILTILDVRIYKKAFFND